MINTHGESDLHREMMALSEVEYFSSPAKLHFKYTTMNGGKSATMLRIAYNYKNYNKQHILIAKPSVDSKGGNKIVSRAENLETECDFLIDGKTSIVEQVYPHMVKVASEHNKRISAILIDESQFLNKEDVEELVYLSTVVGIPVMCFGLRTDYQGNLFEGSSHLFAYAHDIEELTTRPMSARGNKDEKATMNLRIKNGTPCFKGEQILIDGEEDEIEYVPVSLHAYLKEYELSCIREHLDDKDFGRGYFEWWVRPLVIKMRGGDKKND